MSRRPCFIIDINPLNDLHLPLSPLIKALCVMINLCNNDLRYFFERILEYSGPSPPPGSGYHGYQFLLIEQPENLDTSTLSEDVLGGRGNFDADSFLHDSELCDKIVAKFQFRTKKD